MKVGLVHISGSLRGIPARNLTVDEVKKYGGEDYLTMNGVYEKPKPKANKMSLGGKENKEVKNERN